MAGLAAVCRFSAILSFICCFGLVFAASDSCSLEGGLQITPLRNEFGCPSCVGGPLQICEGLLWKNMCDENWTREDATVACRTLGYFSEGFNISLGGQGPNPSINGVRCNGDENQLSDCPAGDSHVSGTNCMANIRVGCARLNSTDSTVPSTTVLSIETTTTTTKTEQQQPSTSESTTPLRTTSTYTQEDASTLASLPGSEAESSFFSGPGLYIFIGGVGAVVVAIMVLVQILLTCWCCLRYRARGVSPCDPEKQKENTKGREDDMQLDSPSKDPTTKASSIPRDHHQLQQSPPKGGGPVYESINDKKPAQDSHRYHLKYPNSGLYSELDKSELYAQIQPCMAPPRSALGEAQYQTVQKPVENTQYQVLDHPRSSSLKRGVPPPPMQAVNRLAMELCVPEGLVAPPPLPRKGSMQSPQAEGISSERELPGISTTDQDTNIYHTIEPPPDYATLEETEDSAPVQNSGQAKRRQNSLGSPSLSALVGQPRERALSKSSISTAPSMHSSSHSSLTSSLSNHSPQVSRSVNNHSPLVAMVNNGPRSTNKYTESPVPSRKDLIIQEGSPKKTEHIESSDRSEMYTLV